MNRMSALKSEFKAKGVQLETKPSEACYLGQCDGTGILHYIDWAAKVEAMENPTEFYAQRRQLEWFDKCKCREQIRMENKITSAGIPEAFKHAKVLGFKTDIYKSQFNRDAALLAKEVASNFVEKFEEIAHRGKGLYFSSKTKGSGKTRLASSIANALIKLHKCNVLFVKANDIALQVRKTYQKNSEISEDDVLKVFREVEILVIDDLAVDDKTGFSEDLLGKILDFRMDKQLITIITSNRLVDELESFYPKGIIGSRVRKMCYEVIMPEESVRDEESVEENRAFEDILFGEVQA